MAIYDWWFCLCVTRIVVETIGRSIASFKKSQKGKCHEKIFIVDCKIVHWGGGISIAILSICSLMYYFSGVHINNPTGTTDYTLESSQIVINMKEGFAWNRMDENGFNNIGSKDEKIDVLFLGSSQVIATNIFASDNMTHLLENLLKDKETYNMGQDKHTICVNVKNMDNIISEFHSEKYIVLETNTVKPDEVDLEKVIKGKYENLEFYDKGMLYLFQNPHARTPGTTINETVQTVGY